IFSSRHTSPSSLFPLSLHDALPIFLLHRLFLHDAQYVQRRRLGAANEAGAAAARAADVRSLFQRGLQPLARELHQAEARNLADRSEEHTSELQSLAYLVCRLLLEKK